MTTTLVQQSMHNTRPSRLGSLLPVSFRGAAPAAAISIRSSTPTGDRRIQTFSFAAPTALSVQLVGDFTHWQEKPINMQKTSHGVWQATVELDPGSHHYRFLVDGQWRDDPECTIRVSNPCGSQDAVRQVA